MMPGLGDLVCFSRFREPPSLPQTRHVGPDVGNGGEMLDFALGSRLDGAKVPMAAECSHKPQVALAVRRERFAELLAGTADATDAGADDLVGDSDVGPGFVCEGGHGLNGAGVKVTLRLSSSVAIPLAILALAKDC